MAFFIRGSAYATRHVNNGSIHALQMEFHQRHGIRMLALKAEDKISMASLLQLLQRTDALFGVFGANLANAIYLRPGALLLEFLTCFAKPGFSCAGWVDNTPEAGDQERNRDYLTLARHARLAYYCVDIRHFQNDINGGSMLPAAYVQRLAADFAITYAVERTKVTEGLRDGEAKLCEAAPCTKADATGASPALSSPNYSRCYMNLRPNCWVVSLGPHSQSCAAFEEPYQLCSPGRETRFSRPSGRF